MNRRKFLIGMGSLAAGSAAAVGTGAFTSVQANRNFGVTIADDAQAYLAIEPASGPNGGYAYELGEDVEIELGGGIGAGSPAGDGVNAQALTQIDKIFKIKNQGTQPVNVKIDKSNLESASDNFTDEQVRDVLTFYRGDNPNVNDIEKGGYTLGTGEEILVGIQVDLTNYGGANDYSEDLERLIDDGGYGNLVIRADAVSNDT
jgi:hypothetical protein